MKLRLTYAMAVGLVCVLLIIVVVGVGAMAQQPTDEQKVAANKAWVRTTYVWLGDERGSEKFTWEGVKVAVPRPPALTVRYEAGKQIVQGKDEYKKWYDAWLLPYTEHPCDFSRPPDEAQVSDWRNAKRWLFHRETGHFPKFIPPYPQSPGGNSPAAIG